jgi:tetratricopeptide (TPR) repeat protein
MKFVLTIFGFFLLAINANAEKQYDFNTTCQQAFQEITKLKINSGMALVAKAKQQNPDNLIPLLLEDYIDFFVLFLNEDNNEFKIRNPHFSERITLLEKGPKSSPFYLFCLSTVRLHQAAVGVKFGQTWQAGWDFRKAFILLKENQKKFPDFQPNNLMSGSLIAIIGTIPSSYKWIASIFGLKGSIKEGMRMVHNFTYSNDPWAKLFANESAFIYPFLLFYIENKKDEALQFVQQRKLDIVHNHLLCYMAVNLSINNKQSAAAELMMQNRDQSNEYLKLPVWDFEMGFVKLYHVELPDAAKYLEQFQKDFTGKFYVKDAYNKLSLAYYLQGNMQAANASRKLILQKGATDTDADKKAMKDAKSATWPNAMLLRARLLSDGGYHKEALAILYGKSLDQFNSNEDKLEFAYRVARIYDDLGRKDEAIQAYILAISLGEHSQEHYAARAALQIGQIYEDRGQKALAITYYQKCLDMDNHEYKDSLDQRAKSGISRCKGE